MAQRTQRPVDQALLEDLLNRVRVLEGSVKDIRRSLGDLDVPPTQEGQLDALRELVVDERFRVRLHALVNRTIDRCLKTIAAPDLEAATTVPFTNEEFERRVEEYKSAASVPAQMIGEGCYWGELWTAPLWASAIERLANANPGSNGIVVWLHLRRLPALIAMYAAGIGAVAGSRYGNLRAILVDPRIREPSRTQPAAIALAPGNVLELEVARRLPGMERRYTPVSDWLFAVCRDWLRDVIPSDDDYLQAFDRYEFLMGLVHFDILSRGWAPVGRFAWRRSHYPADDVVDAITNEIASDPCPPIGQRPSRTPAIEARRATRSATSRPSLSQAPGRPPPCHIRRPRAQSW
jgi:hypothetical protein